MKWNKNLTIFCVAFASFILALVFDHQIMLLISIIKNPFIDKVFSLLFFIEKDILFYPLIILITTLAILFQHNGKISRKISIYILSLIVITIISFLLKFIIARPRPNLYSKHSFPSGHSALLFASLPFLKNKLVTVIWLILSCILVLVRIWVGMHYLSDIIAGAIIGYYIPFIVQKIIEKKFKKKTRKKRDK